MVELKILKEFKHEGRKLEKGEIAELPPRKAIELIEEGTARTASYSDFSGA